MPEVRQALVVGGTRGIGAAIALALAESGWPTAVAARGQRQRDEFAARASARGLRVRTYHVDVTCADSVDLLFEQVCADGELGVCVSAAGRNLSRPLLRAPREAGGTWSAHDVDEWRHTIDLCLTGTFLVGRRAALAMARAGTGGVIIPIASSTWRGSWGQSAYAAAKAAVVSMTRSWALELAEHGIRVVAIAPGVVDGTALRDKAAAHPNHARFMERLRQRIPLGRFADPAEIADSALYAVRNDYLTGTVLEVAGGGFPPKID
ncbi:SDR family oxidoreductase [Saccharopolyspora indica]|uniref:SDR family oxidoreductase n=1 Tax=Saccharopolyspora indica TaxID=1229659 RepID=UPI0022EB3245|nr:SDR family oxidoreductase [Saccharopolyspora indica]MDA3648111.1 SDR family oxidoreductase [Saccharopolyspora indica]